MQDQILLIAHVHHLVNNLFNEVHTSFFVAEMWPHWTLSQLLHKYIDEPIKDTRRIEKLSENSIAFIRSLCVDEIV